MSDIFLAFEPTQMTLSDLSITTEVFGFSVANINVSLSSSINLLKLKVFALSDTLAARIPVLHQLLSTSFEKRVDAIQALFLYFFATLGQLYVVTARFPRHQCESTQFHKSIRIEIRCVHCQFVLLSACREHHLSICAQIEQVCIVLMSATTSEVTQCRE